MELTIEVVEITRKGEHLGYKVYINDFVQAAKLPRKPGDLKLPTEDDKIKYVRKRLLVKTLQSIQSISVPDESQDTKDKVHAFTGDAMAQTCADIESQISVDYYTGTLVESIQYALIDWQIWKEQGYKRAD